MKICLVGQHKGGLGQDRGPLHLFALQVHHLKHRNTKMPLTLTLRPSCLFNFMVADQSLQRRIRTPTWAACLEDCIGTRNSELFI